MMPILTLWTQVCKLPCRTYIGHPKHCFPLSKIHCLRCVWMATETPWHFWEPIVSALNDSILFHLWKVHANLSKHQISYCDKKRHVFSCLILLDWSTKRTLILSVKLEIERKDTSDSSRNGESLSMWKGTLKLCDDDNTRICIWNAEWNVWNTDTVEGSDWWSVYIDFFLILILVWVLKWWWVK